MKKLFTLVAIALSSIGAFAQAHCEWTAAQLPANRFATVDEAVAAGYNTMWASADFLGMPAQNLIDNEKVTVSLPLAYNYVSKGNNKYSGVDYAYKLIMGMEGSTRSGIDATNFYEGVENNPYIRKAGDSDQGNVINDAVIKVEVKSAEHGIVTIKYNRGSNTSAMYVVDQTANEGMGMMVLQTVTRNAEDGSPIMAHVSRFGVEPGHTYYIMASEKGSVEFYGISYDECADDAYVTEVSEANSTELWTAAQLPASRFATVDEAVAAGYNTMWASADFLGMPAQELVNSKNINISLPLAYNYVAKGNNKYSGGEYAYKLMMGMEGSTRSGIDAANFYEGVVNNPYVRKAGDTDQGNVVNDAMLKIEVPAESTYGRVILNYNRGGNSSAMYVVDQTANEGMGMNVLQTVNRCPDDVIKTHSAVFNVEPGHTYYVLASEKGSVEFYAIGFCAANSDKYAAIGTSTGIDSIVTENGVKPADNKIYSIDGRFVGTEKEGLVKGLYIQNGKKFVVK